MREVGANYLRGGMTQLLGQEDVGLEPLEYPHEMGEIGTARQEIGRHQTDRSVHGRRTLTTPRALQPIEKLRRSYLGRWTYMPTEYV